MNEGDGVTASEIGCKLVVVEDELATVGVGWWAHPDVDDALVAEARDRVDRLELERNGLGDIARGCSSRSLWST